MVKKTKKTTVRVMAKQKKYDTSIYNPNSRCPLCGRSDEHVYIGNGHAYEIYYGRKPLPGEVTIRMY